MVQLKLIIYNPTICSILTDRQSGRPVGGEIMANFEQRVALGRNAVAEAMKAGESVQCVYVAAGVSESELSLLRRLCREAGVPLKNVDRRKLEKYGSKNQGVVALLADAEYSTLEDVFKRAEEKGEPPFIIVCDGIEDPHNLGSIIRSANLFGAHGVIVPKRGAAGLTAVVSKASAGAVWHTPVVRVTNITETLKELKKRGLWVYGADADGTSVDGDVDLSGAAALVIGAEGDGISRLVRENCDVMLSIPMRGDIESLNASVAAGILMYLFMEGRK